jgi:hypothetical protein
MIVLSVNKARLVESTRFTWEFVLVAENGLALNDLQRSTFNVKESDPYKEPPSEYD